MTDRRCRDADIAMSDAMPFAQHYEIRTTFPVEERAADPLFLMNVRSRLRAGDRINLVRYENDTWDRVLEILEGLRVVHVDNAGVELLQTAQAIKLDHPGEEGVVVARGFAGQFAVRFEGATVGVRNTIVEANEFAAEIGREKGVPVKLYEAKASRPRAA